jgi:hypothetical protein
MDRRDLERLGHDVVSRRVALGYRNRTDLADSVAFTVRTLADIEHGVRKRGCCWSYDAASSPPATHAARRGTTGTAA